VAISLLVTLLMSPNLGGILEKIGDTPSTPAGEHLLHLCYLANLFLRARVMDIDTP